jgi:DNA-binding transcriptional LysR family regulator
MFEWSDLRYFLAVARHGSTLAAARALGTSQSTVQRRLSELERKLGRPLFSRHASGYRMTEFGAEMLPYAERVEHSVQTFEQQKATVERGVVGVIRLTCPEPLMGRLTQSKIFERFHAQHPKLRVEFVMSDRYLDITKGDADVALRSGDTDDDVLVGRKIADSFWGAYASKEYLERNGKPAAVSDLNSHAIIGFDDTMMNHRAAIWLREVAPEARIAARVNSVLGLVAAAKSGVGVAPLPTALGDNEVELESLLGPVPALTRSWRLLTHPDLRRTPRVAAFFDFIMAEQAALRPILSG